MGFKPRPYDDLFSEKTDVQIQLVVLMKGCCEDRALELIPEQTRAVRRHDIHEFILTDEPDASPGNRVDRIAYIGFGEVTSGGVLAIGDRISACGNTIGILAGFDYTHMPNHMNIVLYSPDLRAGEEQGLRPGQVMTANRPVRNRAGDE